MKNSRHFTLLLLLVALASQSLRAADQTDKIQALEKRVEQLERLLQARDAQPSSPGEAPKPSETPKPTPTLSVGSSGFAMRSADSNFVLRIRALLQFDSRWSDDGDIDDSFLMRRVRPILEGTVFRDFNFLITPEFAGFTPALDFTHRRRSTHPVKTPLRPGQTEHAMKAVFGQLAPHIDRD